MIILRLLTLFLLSFAIHIPEAARRDRLQTKGSRAKKPPPKKTGLTHREIFEHLSLATAAMNKRDFSGALNVYNDLIDKHQSKDIFHGRAMVHYAADNLDGAIQDLDKALGFESRFPSTETYFFRGLARMRIGSCVDSAVDFRRVLDINPKHIDAIHQYPHASQCQDLKARIDPYMERGDCNGARAQGLEILVEIINRNLDYNLFYAKCLADQRDHLNVLKYATNILKTHPLDIDSIYLGAKAYYAVEDFENAAAFCKQGLDSTAEGAKVEELEELHTRIRRIKNLIGKAEQSIAKKQDKAAMHFLNEAIAVDPRHDKLRKRLVRERCKVATEYADLPAEKRVQMCRVAKDLAPSLAESYANLGRAYFLAKSYADARAQYSEATKRMPDNDEWRKALKACEKALLRAGQIDFYGILDVPRDATSRDLKKALRKCGAENHPDKCQTEECDKMFKECVQAHDILTDPKLRKRHDKGEDVLEFLKNGGDSW